MAKVKLFNKNKFDIGIKLINPIREQNIKSGSFTIVEEDDVYYLDTTCSLLKRGMLVIDNADVNINLGFIEKNPNIVDEEQIFAILRGNFLKMKKELGEITEPHTISFIYFVATSIANELSGAKLKFLSEFCGREILINDIK